MILVFLKHDSKEQLKLSSRCFKISIEKYSKMRLTLITKLFFIAFLFGVLIFLMLLQKPRLITKPHKNYITQVTKLIKMSTTSTPNFEEHGLKYILQYTFPTDIPFAYMGIGREGFIRRNCKYTNCVVTADPQYLGDVKKFDVVAFAGPEIFYEIRDFFPEQRSLHQKYVFACIESSGNYPLCSNQFDGFFNWTWTYRLDSDVRWGYMDITDTEGRIIGPNKIMHWIKVEDMDPVNDVMKEKLKHKTKSAAWFTSNCMTTSERFEFASELQEELERYDLRLDMYGECGTMNCSKEKHHECMQLVDRTYYFYLSFENSFGEDYVTEKLLQALQVDVIPIVYGAANYTRFMPDGIYLNARELGPQKLAAKMNELIKNPEEYANYFRWKKYYSYHSKHERPETNEYCRMCEILNDEEKVKKTTIIQNFRDWWDSPKMC